MIPEVSYWLEHSHSKDKQLEDLLWEGAQFPKIKLTKHTGRVLPRDRILVASALVSVSQWFVLGKAVAAAWSSRSLE